MENYQLSLSQFANHILVQRSTLSHVMSGRNKASLEFVQKILTRYPEIEERWLLFGESEMIKVGKKELEPDIPNIDLFSPELVQPKETSINTDNKELEVDLEPNLEALESNIKANPLLEEEINTVEEPKFEEKIESQIKEEIKPEYKVLQSLSTEKRSDEIDKIIIFYKDGTFDSFNSRQKK